MLKFSHEAEAVFQALADPVRRRMLERLSASPATVSELAAPLSVSLPGAMQHLAVLEACGLVRSEKTGRVRTCALVPEGLGPADQWFRALRGQWEQRLDGLEAWLD